MPYQSIQDLPERVTDHLPEHAQEIYVAAFNSAYEQYDQPEERRPDEDGERPDREEVAHKVAWAAVKKAGYEKNEETGMWEKTGE